MNSFFPALNSSPAVMFNWERWLGSDFENAKPFLRPIQEPAETYPCTDSHPCGCSHEVAHSAPGRIVAFCTCDDSSGCEKIHLQESDLIQYELDLRKLGDAVSRALGLESMPVERSGVVKQLWRIGRYRHCLVYFSPDELTATMAAFISTEPCLVAVATERETSSQVREMLLRSGCGVLVLDQLLQLTGPSRFTPSATLPATLEACLPKGSASIAMMFSNIQHEIATIRDQKVQATPTPPPQLSQPARPQYALRRGLGVWKLIFNGEEAEIRHEKGLLYIAYLLAHPNEEPIHAIDLNSRLPEVYRNQLGLSPLIDPTTGKSIIVEASSRLQERSLRLDDIEAMKMIFKKEKELEAVLDDASATEPEKAEALRELEQIAEFQRKHNRGTEGNAEKVIRAVRKAIQRCINNVSKAVDANGKPHRALRLFAKHLEECLLLPSSKEPSGYLIYRSSVGPWPA